MPRACASLRSGLVRYGVTYFIGLVPWLGGLNAGFCPDDAVLAILCANDPVSRVSLGLNGFVGLSVCGECECHDLGSFVPMIDNATTLT